MGAKTDVNVAIADEHLADVPAVVKLVGTLRMAEPSGAVATAGFIFHAKELPQTKLNVAIISGGNIEPQMLEELRRA